ncbi:hypothetical protein DL96DRAFT_525808 [Flagelloscypha sp. PMI_526]|nr:hypothetical protein DL96DRAFT_525808 [Flagelloscypha sp. PMI_526]
MTACVEDVQEVKNRNFNALDSCVAASAVLGPQYVSDTLGCTSKTGLDFTKTSVGHLNFGIYADMVGKCAYNKPKACSITQQDFVDFIYGTLDDVCSTVWPDIKEVNNQWSKIVKWTKTGTSIPYSNFDDYLHYY